MGHWNSWDDDAIVQDKKTGLFAHPDKVRRIDHEGMYFKSRGPFTVPRSKQGHPVIIQAGQSGPGKRFAARWGELLFVGSPISLDVGRKNYREMKDAVAAQGRDPEHCIIAPSAYVIAAESKAEAEDKAALVETLATDDDALSLLSEVMNFDFATKGLDEPFTDEELAGISGTQSMRDRVVQLSASESDPEGLHHVQPARAPHQAIRRGAEGRRGWAGGVVLHRGLRWLRRRRDQRARLVRGLREIRDPGTAAAWPVPQGLHGGNAAGKPRPPDSEGATLTDVLLCAVPD
jgi:hypothetical protein